MILSINNLGRVMTEFNFEEYEKRKKIIDEDRASNALSCGVFGCGDIGSGGVIDRSISEYLSAIEGMEFSQFSALCYAVSIFAFQEYCYTEDCKLTSFEKSKADIINDSLFDDGGIIRAAVAIGG